MNEISTKTRDAFGTVLKLVRVQLECIEYEVQEQVHGSPYTKNDLEDAKEAITTVEEAIERMIDGDILERIVKEAIEHWPDAENWPIIKEAQDVLSDR